MFQQLESHGFLYLRQLFLHFNNIGLTHDVYATQWLITLFSRDMKSNMVHIIIDLFLIHGYEVLIKVILTILKLAEPELIKSNFEDCMSILKNFLSTADITPKAFFNVFDKQFDFSNINEQSFYEKPQIRLSQQVCLS